MASSFYDKRLPDYTDPDNDTGNCPSFRLGISENDGGVGIFMGQINDNIDGPTNYRAFLNVGEAQELLNCLQQAIDRAAPKNASHRDRVRQP